MDTTFVLKKEELTIDFLEKIKVLFSKATVLQISVCEAEDFGLNKKETKAEYETRLTKAINDVNKISFSENEFDVVVNQNL